MQGYVGLCRAVYGCVGLCKAIYGFVRVCWAVYITNVKPLYDAYTTYLPPLRNVPLTGTGMMSALKEQNHGGVTIHLEGLT